MKNLFLTLFLSLSVPSFAGELTALEATEKLKGVYQGTWKSFVYNQGQTRPGMTWSDRIVAKGEVIEDEDKVYLEAKMTMTYPGGHKQNMEIKEGYLKLGSEGKKGTRFSIMYGKATLYHELSSLEFAASIPPYPGEAKRLGFSPEHVKKMSHVITKTVDHSSGVETHHITRVTTVKLAKRTIQFVSLQGTHRKVE